MPLHLRDLGLFPRIYRDAIQRMLADYGRVFGGRTAELTALDAFFANGRPSYALMLAPTGRGKTALLMHWLKHIQQRSGRSVFLSISRRYQTASAPVALAALATALAGIHGETLAGQTIAPDQLRPLIAAYLGRDLPPAQRLIVVIDGMDEAVGWRVNDELFPAQLGRGVQVLGAARQIAHVTVADWCEQLGWPPSAVQQFALPVLELPAVANVVDAAGLPSLRAYVPQLARVSEGDPLTLRLLVEALQNGTLAPDSLSRQPPGLEDQLQGWLADLLQDSRQSAIRTLLALCALAFGPLTSADVRALAPELAVGADTVQLAARAVGRFILGEGTAERGYVFSHPRLRETFQERVLSADERHRVRQRFIAYGQRWMASRPTPLPVYLRQFWIAHLAEAGAWDVAAAVLAHTSAQAGIRRQRWAAARSAAEGSYAGYLSDLDMLWRYAEQTYDLPLGIRCALIASSLRSLSAELTPRLLVKLVTVGTRAGRWSVAAALEHLRHMPEPAWHRPSALEALMTALPDLPPEPVLEIIRTLLRPADKAHLLITYAPRLPATHRQQLYGEALETDSRVIVQRYYEWAAEIVPTLIAALAPDTLLRLLLELARHTESHFEQTQRSQALARLLEQLPESVIGQAFDAAAAHDDIWQRQKMVVGLASTGRATLVSAAFTVVAGLPAERARAIGISRLSRLLPDTLIRTAFDLALGIADRQSRHIAMMSLAARLPSDLVQQVFEQACAGDDEERAALFPALAPQLAPERLERALALVRAIADADKRYDALGRLLPFLHSLPIGTIFQAIAELPKPLSRLIGLIQLRPRLSGEHLARVDGDLAGILGDPQQALEASLVLLLLPLLEPPTHVLPQDLIDRLWQAMRPRFHAITSPQIVGALMRYPPSTNRPELYADLVDAVCANDDEQLIGTAIHHMIPVLTPELQQRVLQRARSARSSGFALGVISALAGHLQPALLAQSLDIVQAIAAADRSRTSIDTLVDLAQYFPNHEQPAMYHEALRLSQQIWDTREHVRTLLALLPAFRPTRRAGFYRYLRDHLAQSADTSHSVDELLAQAEHLPDPVRRRVHRLLLDLSRRNPAVLMTGLAWFHGRLRHEAADLLLRYLGQRIQAKPDDEQVIDGLIAAIPALPRTFLGRAERIARLSGHHRNYAQVLARLAQRSGPVQQRTLYAEVLAIIRSRPAAVNPRLEQLLPYLPAPMASMLAGELLDQIHAAAARPLARTLAQLAPYLAPAALESALGHVSSYRYDRAIERIDAWLALVPYLPLSQHPQAYAAIFAHLPYITLMGDYARAFRQLVPHLPHTLLPRVVAAAYAVSTKQTSAQFGGGPIQPDDGEPYRSLCTTLTAVLPHLPLDQQSAVVEDCINTALRIARPQERVLALLALLPHLSPERQAALAREALQATYAHTPYDWGRVYMLAKVVPWLKRVASHSPDFDPRDDWQQAVRGFAPYGRALVVASLGAMASWLATMASSEDLAAISAAVLEISECWP